MLIIIIIWLNYKLTKLFEGFERAIAFNHYDLPTISITIIIMIVLIIDICDSLLLWAD